jgi:hypothetical protein
MAAQPAEGSVAQVFILEERLSEDGMTQPRSQPIDLSGSKAKFDPTFKEPGKILHEASCFAPFVMVHCGFLGETRSTLQCMFSCADTSWSDERRSEVRSRCDIYPDARKAHEKLIEKLEANADVFYDLRQMMP